MRPHRVLTAVAALLLLAGCGGDSEEAAPAEATETTESATPAEPAPAPVSTKPAEPIPAVDLVDWSIYAPPVKDRIVALGAAKDCTGLQTEFDTASDNNSATLARTGTSNVKLMDYLDDLLASSGCY